MGMMTVEKITTLNEYQQAASRTAIYPGRESKDGINYCAIGLAGEVGEFLNKWKKVLRDDDFSHHAGLVDELADVLWYAAMAADELGVTLEDVANRNIEKLASRQERGKIKGNGDDR
jgi:NTP pyrophosphatase (non-canonical NTP hydrolase)